MNQALDRGRKLLTKAIFSLDVTIHIVAIVYTHYGFIGVPTRDVGRTREKLVKLFITGVSHALLAFSPYIYQAFGRITILYHAIDYSDQHNQCDIRAAHYGKVVCNTVKYTTAFLYSVWLYFVRNGINNKNGLS